jgi:hypothetical protein
MSRPSARHKKQSRFVSAPAGMPPQHRRQSPSGLARRRPAARLAAAGAGAILLVGGAAGVALAHRPGQSPHSARGVADALAAGGSGAAATESAAGGQLNEQWLKGFMAQSGISARASSRQPKHPVAKPTPAAPPVYRNPLRGVVGLVPERIDMGVDFGGSGPVYALGNAVITNATGSSAGWPGGGWITYRLTGGPAAGLSVYVAEDVRPSVQVGQEVTPATVIATMFNGGAGIETGWAQPEGASAESQLPEAGAVGGGGPFPTEVGLNFEELLRVLGVSASPNIAEPGHGIVPPNYPAVWTAVQ